MNGKNNPLQTAGLSTGQNENMPGGILNNLPPSSLHRGPGKKKLDKVKEPPSHKRGRSREER